MNSLDRDPVEGVIERVRKVYSRWNKRTTIDQMRSDWDALFQSDLTPCKVTDDDAHGVAVRWIDATHGSRGRVVVYFHGGGYKMGSVISHQDVMARLSNAGRCRVLGVSYRMVPEYTFPAPIEDAVKVYRWLTTKIGVAPRDIAFAGDSAGGGLVAATLMSLRESGQPLPAAGVMLSAWTDLEAALPSYETRAAADPIHQRAMIQSVARQYLGEKGHARDPLASPLYGDLSGFPPLLLQVGDRETGLDDSIQFAEKARRAGVEVELEVWDGMIHVFQQFADELVEAREAIAKIGNFLNKHWSAT